MELDPNACYRAVLARDARFDGQFFTCVRTTGIYCRPSCPARPPKLENCLFVPSAAAAQAAGFRPCRRCRPESLPGQAAWRGSAATVARGLALIAAGALDEGDAASLAARLGIGERQLRRLFRRHLGVSPGAVALARRLLLSRQLLECSDLAMTEIAQASGFASLRRFNEAFRQRHGRPPGDLRRPGGAGAPASGIRLFLPYRPPYDWPALLAFLAARALPSVERVEGGEYRRVIALEGELGSLAVAHAPERRALRVVVRFPRLSCLPAIVARVSRVCDLGADPGVIAAHLGRDPLLAGPVARHPGLRVPGAWDGFECAVRAILGQQIAVAAATRLAGRLAAELGAPYAGGAGEEGLSRAFPAPARLVPEAIMGLGLPRARARALASLAAAAAADPRLLAPRGGLAAAVSELRRLPGVGDWTAQYIALRALGESDAFPAGDLVLRRRAGGRGVRPAPRELLARAEAWRPWRAYAALHLWTAAREDGGAPSGGEDDHAPLA